MRLCATSCCKPWLASAAQPELRGGRPAVRWLKVAAFAIGVVIAFLIVSSVIGFLIEAVIAVLVVAVIVLAVKVALGRRQVSSRTPDRAIRGPRSSRRRRRDDRPHVEDELTRLRGEMGGERPV
jgi:hypothetical protein